MMGNIAVEQGSGKASDCGAVTHARADGMLWRWNIKVAPFARCLIVEQQFGTRPMSPIVGVADLC